MGTNAIPAGAMFLGGNSAATAMVLYFLDNIVSALFAAARVRILAPADDKAYADRGMETVETTIDGRTTRRDVLRNRRVLILDYDTHYAHSVRRDPPGPQPFLGLPGDRVMRGGGWMWPEAYEQRAARRLHTTPATRDDYIGFRCAGDFAP